MTAKATAELEVVSDTLTERIAAVAEIAEGMTIGVHDDAEPYPDGTSTATVMAVHEFGTGDIPARAPMRKYFDGGGSRDLSDAIAEAVADALDGMDPERAVQLAGNAAVDGIVRGIASGLTPALASPRGPGHDQRNIPLIDTGHLVSQIKAKVGD